MKRAITLVLGLLLIALPASAQQKTVTGKVTNEQGTAVPGVSVVIKGTRTGTMTNAQGTFSLRAEPGQVIQFRSIGAAPVERTVGAEDVIDVQLRRVAVSLDAVVVSALGQTDVQRALGTAQQMVQGEDVAQTQRLNFVNALQGRIAGVEVITTSGVPGASSSITIRGISSISSSNQPLMVVDGLPIDNKVLHTAALASGRPGASGTSMENRNVDFTNRAADVNPEDIESVVVLKGPEASALYGIDAANGAIVITTKRGKAGISNMDYTATVSYNRAGELPEVQRVYGISGVGSSTNLYWGDPYPTNTPAYDNVSGFFQTAVNTRHNLGFSGGAADGRLNYRLSSSWADEKGVIPHSDLQKLTLTGASTATVTNWLSADLSMMYAYADNAQPFKGSNSPLLGLLVWPHFDDAKNYLTPLGTRRQITTLAGSAEYDNPYFNVNKNKIESKNNRLISNLGITINPFSWGHLKTTVGIDNYANQNLILRHPESAYGFALNGIIDVGNDITRNITSQTLFNINPYKFTKDFSISGMLGNYIRDEKSVTDGTVGTDFLDPNFVSINNANLRYSQSYTQQRRQLSAFGKAQLEFRDYLYVLVTGRNDWTSTIPTERNSFFYPSISTSFIFSDAFPSVRRYLSTGKLRAAYAEVGRDARPYAYRPALEFKSTSYGGYGFGFTGPNFELKPEFKKSFELGADLGFFSDRLGLDATYYSAKTYDQIVNAVRNSYATGFILMNVNGASTKNAGLELTLRGVPVTTDLLQWDIIANFDKSRGKTLKLPNFLPEAYNSDTWVYGNVRNGTAAGLSTRSLTGTFYLRNKQGQVLIDPTTGLPIRSTDFIDRGYDRQPDFMLGVSNSVRYRKSWTLSALLDFRRGGDILNATEHFLTARGLSMRTLDRWEPRVVDGVLRDGKENTATPTRNNIVVVPAINNNYYLAMSEELFIERDINWLRLRDVTLGYQLPPRFRSATVFVTGTDLFLLTNYSGLDPIGSATTVATGGSGSAGIDFGGFPVPRGITFGTRMRF